MSAARDELDRTLAENGGDARASVADVGDELGRIASSIEPLPRDRIRLLGQTLELLAVSGFDPDHRGPDT